AEDGILDRNVTGVQTCALPISPFPVTSAPSGSALSSAPYVVGPVLRRRTRRNRAQAHGAPHGSRARGRRGGNGNYRNRGAMTGQIGRASWRERQEMRGEVGTCE